MRRFTTTLATLTGATLFVVLALASLACSLWYTHGGRLAAVQTGSMRPTFAPGDAVLLTSSSSYKVGDILRYQNPREPSLSITHRLIARGKQLSFQGDALSQPDPPVSPTRVQGRVVAVLPGFGRLIDLLHRPFTLLAIIYLPALVLIANEGWRLAQELKRPYRWHGYRA